MLKQTYIEIEIPFHAKSWPYTILLLWYGIKDLQNED